MVRAGHEDSPRTRAESSSCDAAASALPPRLRRHRHKIAIQGLLFRLRWSKVYEQGIMNGETAADIKMMTINQERFEDPPAH